MGVDGGAPNTPNYNTPLSTEQKKKLAAIIYKKKQQADANGEEFDKEEAIAEAKAQLQAQAAERKATKKIVKKAATKSLCQQQLKLTTR